MCIIWVLIYTKDSILAFTEITFKNPNTGAMKNAPVGFSWTTFFFSFFPPLFRGDFKFAVIIFLLQMISFGLAGCVFAFFYNKLYIKELVNSGYKATGIASGDMNYASAKVGFEIPLFEEKQAA